MLRLPHGDDLLIPQVAGGALLPVVHLHHVLVKGQGGRHLAAVFFHVPLRDLQGDPGRGAVGGHHQRKGRQKQQPRPQCDAPPGKVPYRNGNGRSRRQ